MLKQKIKIKELEKINKLIRYWILDMTTTAGSGHPTSSMSAIELVSTLMYGGFFKFDIADIQNENNDRLIFSKGHASPLFYSLWAGCGALPSTKLNTFRKFDSELEGHPTMRFPFTEAATGSLGQGLSVGIGLALAQKKLDKTKAKTFVLLGDSEMAEGQIWEAMGIASYYELGNLVAIVDVNRLGQRGETMIGHAIDKYTARAKAFGWRTVEVDGHDIEEISQVYDNMLCEHKKPLMIIAKTYKGRGISFLEDKYSWHGKVLNDMEFAEASTELGDIDFNMRINLEKPEKVNIEIPIQQKEIVQIDKNEFDDTKKYATRDAYGETLVELMSENEKIVVLDAEVSNSTRSEKVKEFYPERFFEMFIAEQNMVSIAVGLSRRGYKPFVSTFAAFLTRAHDQIRMARFSESNITFVGSHAGVAIGADGGSQMGLGDISMMRAILGSKVFQPSDFISAKKIFKQCKDGINYVRTNREKTIVFYDEDEDFSINTSKILRKSDEDVATIIASGITVNEALKAYEILKIKDRFIKVIDLYMIKPINGEELKKNIGNIQNVIVVEDSYVEGGIYEAVLNSLNGCNKSFMSLAVSKTPRSATSEELLEYEKIDFNAIIEKVEKIIK
jgi:transketolase